MKKLRRALVFSSVFAVFSMFVLFSSYVRSAVAHEPNVGAAVTEQHDEIVEIIVVEHDLHVQLPSNEILEIETNDLDTEVISETVTDDLTETPLTPEPKEVKVIELKKSPEKTALETEQKALTGIEVEIHQRSNQARTKRGEDALIFDETLATFARDRSRDMIGRDYFSHTSPDGCGIACNFVSSDYNTLVWAENIARYEPYDEASMKIVAEVFVEKWLKSSEHRDNLLSSEYTHEGVGVAVKDKKIIVTVIFAKPE